MKPLVSPEPRQAEELRKLRFNKDLMEYLESCESRAKDALIQCPTDADFRAMQGQAQAYGTILKLIRVNETPKIVPSKRQNMR